MTCFLVHRTYLGPITIKAQKSLYLPCITQHHYSYLLFHHLMQDHSLVSVILVYYCGSYWNIKEANGLVVFQLDIENNSAQKVWQEVEFVFGKYMLDILVLYTGL